MYWVQGAGRLVKVKEGEEDQAGGGFRQLSRVTPETGERAGR